MSSLFDLRGKVAVVTGGNGGIGLSFAKGLGEAGASISIWARNEEKNQKAVAELKALGINAISCVADVTNRGQIDSAVEKTVAEFGGIDILIANAGVNLRKRPEKFSAEEFSGVLVANVTSTMECAQAVYPEMKKRGGGKIVTVGSMTSIFGFGISAAYSSSKGAVVQLSKSLAAAWGSDNIQVNAILPGWIETDMTVETRGIHSVVDQVLQRTPAGRWGVPDDLAGAAVFFSSSASNFITGTALPVDGGFASTLFLVDPPDK
ncbi:MAG: glucose 1-dehydrogenase [Actinomycetota bacterium]